MTAADDTSSLPTPAVTTHLLAVDDEPDLESLMRQRFRKALRAGTMILHFARSGSEALEQLAAHPEVEVVVSDINMPGMDGLTLLGETRARFPTVKTIIVSAYGDMENIRRAMNQGAFDFVTKPVDFADLERTIDKTAKQVRELRASLEQLKASNILKMFVDEAVVHYANHKAQEPAAAAENVSVDRTVVFVDICSFTSLSERHDARFVLALLNRYFDAIVGRIVANDGHVDKFIGDAVMATFEGDGAASRACKAALEARAAVREMRGEMENRVGFFPDVSVGIHAGTVIAGPVGASIVGRLDFTIIGDVVNTAARLQRVAGPGEIVVSEVIRSRLGPGFWLEERGVHTIRGKAEPLLLFTVRGRASEHLSVPPSTLFLTS